MFVFDTNKKQITELSHVFTKSIIGKIYFKWSVDIQTILRNG